VFDNTADYPKETSRRVDPKAGAERLSCAAFAVRACHYFLTQRLSIVITHALAIVASLLGIRNFEGVFVEFAWLVS
jgi:hypothetical protein